MRRPKGVSAQQAPSQQAMALRCQIEALSLQSGDPVAVRRLFYGGKCLQATSQGQNEKISIILWSSRGTILKDKNLRRVFGWTQLWRRRRSRGSSHWRCRPRRLR